MKNVLIPTDFSFCARNAIQYTMDSFGHKEVQYFFLNTYVQPTSTAGMMVSFIERMREDSVKGMDNEIEYFRDLLPSEANSIIGLTEYGSLPTIVDREVKDRDIDFVVVGTKGADGFDKFISGSNASDLIRSIKCPLLIVPELSRFTKIKTLGFAADFERLKNYEITKPIDHLLQNMDTNLVVVNVRKEGEELGLEKGAARVNLKSLFKDKGYLVSNVENDSIVNGINKFCKDYSLDLLVMIARKHGFFESIFRKSITKEIAMIGEVPLVIINE